MKKSILSIAIAALAITSISSCKKDDDNNTTPGRSAMIVGTWKDTQQGDDVNNNNIWDASEQTSIPASDQSTAVFNSNGTGSVTIDFLGTPITGTTKWNIYNNDKNIRIIANVLGTTDTAYGVFTSFTSNQFVIKDTTTSPISFTQFTKQ